MRVSAAICTRNRADLIGQAVASVLANNHPDFELIIIDQSDADDTRQAIAPMLASHPNLRYIHTTRVGLSAAYNTAIAHTTGEIIAFTDDDCVAPNDWLSQVERSFAQHPDAALLYGQVMMPSTLKDAPGVVPVLGIAATRRISRRDGFKIYGMGANFAARRRLFTTIGGFDEVLGGGGPLRSSQDFDLQYRVYRAGLVTLLSPNVKVDHYGLRSAADWPKTLFAYGVGDGGFYMKHVRCGDWFAASLFLRRVAFDLPIILMKAALGRRNNVPYTRGFLDGIRGSFRFGINRGHRVYVA